VELTGPVTQMETASGIPAATQISPHKEIRFPHSLGLLYSAFTYYTGFKVNSAEYKVMGLAAYGRPTMIDAVRKLIRRTPDGAFTLDMTYFEYQTTAARSYSPRFVALFGRPRHPYEPIDLETADGRFADCAASVQRVLEDALVDMTRAHARNRAAGSVPRWRRNLNGVANARSAESGFERCSTPPAPGDAGCALARRSCRSHLLGNPIGSTDHPFWGRRSIHRNWRAPRVRRTARRGADDVVLLNALPISSLPAVSSAGWTAPPSSVRARSAIAASWRRHTRSRCAIGSIATSRTVRSFARLRR
jgi:predicted NodU family carbamoyl transferase